MDMEFEDLTWYVFAGYAGELFQIIVVLFVLLTIYGYIIGGKK